MTDPNRPGDADPPPARTVLDLVPPGQVAEAIRDGFDAALLPEIQRVMGVPGEMLAPPRPVAALVEPCNAAATTIVFRGKTRRLYLCAAHRGRYTGSGKVAPYRGLSQFDPPEDPRPGEFTGPVRRCGETT